MNSSGIVVPDLSKRVVEVYDSLIVNDIQLLDSFGYSHSSNPSYFCGSNIGTMHSNSIVINAANVNVNTTSENSLTMNSPNGVLFSVPMSIEDNTILQNTHSFYIDGVNLKLKMIKNGQIIDRVIQTT